MKIEAENDSDPDRLREMKIEIPADLHADLWRIKIIEGDDLRDMVAEAVEQYLEERGVP